MPDSQIQRVWDILLMEDNPGDVRLVTECLRAGAYPHRLTVAADGNEALDVLFHRGSFAEALQPDLMLLDWNLPLKDGREVLAEIKAHPRLRRIPVVVLTSSKADSDIQAAYDLQANAFVTKPIDFESYARVIGEVAAFWFKVVKLPRK